MSPDIAEFDKKDFREVNLSISAMVSFSWIVISDWSQNSLQFIMSPSNFGSLLLVIYL